MVGLENSLIIKEFRDITKGLYAPISITIANNLDYNTDSYNSLWRKDVDTTTSGAFYREYLSSWDDAGTSATGYDIQSSNNYNYNYKTTRIYNNNIEFTYAATGEILRKTTWRSPVIPPEERMRRIIQERMAPIVIIRGKKRESLSIAIDEREERARQTLRRIIGQQAFRKFIRDGFITVVSKSGLTYRIYPGHGMTDVYDRGIMVERLCVVLQGRFPPTDSLIMRYLLILNDEGEFSKYAVKHSAGSGSVLQLPKQDNRNLAEVWAEIKAVA